MTATLTRGEQVARRRQAFGLTQEELARLLGCSLRTVQRVEDNANPGLSQRLVEALNKHLRMPVEELLTVKRRRARRN